LPWAPTLEQIPSICFFQADSESGAPVVLAAVVPLDVVVLVDVAVFAAVEAAVLEVVLELLLLLLPQPASSAAIAMGAIRAERFFIARTVRICAPDAFARQRTPQFG
jgi:hypothetical protein